MTQQSINGEDKVSNAINILKQYEPEGGYRLAFSGGKDSICCYHLCKLAGVKFEAHYAFTTIDPPEVVKVIREHYSDVIIDKPYFKGEQTNFYKLVTMKGLPRRRFRWCCERLKEVNAPKGSTVVLGIRSEESPKRRGREIYGEYKGRYNVLPIYDWTTDDVWSFIHSSNLPYPSLYDKGHKRLGCIMCPLSCKAARVRDYEEYPNHVNAIKISLTKFLQTHPNCSLNTGRWGGDVDMIIYEWIYDSPVQSAKGKCLGDYIKND